MVHLIKRHQNKFDEIVKLSELTKTFPLFVTRAEIPILYFSDRICVNEIDEWGNPTGRHIITSVVLQYTDNAYMGYNCDCLIVTVDDVVPDSYCDQGIYNSVWHVVKENKENYREGYLEGVCVVHADSLPVDAELGTIFIVPQKEPGTDAALVDTDKYGVYIRNIGQYDLIDIISNNMEENEDGTCNNEE